MSSDKDFDLFQMFEVEHLPCAILTVTVLGARKVSKGWLGNLVDTPDPYVKLIVKDAAVPENTTKKFDNNINPEWNETFEFYVNGEKEHELEIYIMDSNFTIDETLGHQKFHINAGNMERKKLTLKMEYECELDIEIESKINSNPDLRYSLGLCSEEKEFRKARKQTVFKNMQRILEDNGPKTEKETPTIGILGSGGGFRAMVGMGAVMSALSQSQTLDMVTYIGALSGSSWYMSQLYSNPKWPSSSPCDLQEDLKENVKHSQLWLYTPSRLYQYFEAVLKKKELGQPVSFTDVFGHLIGETLIKDRKDFKLTDMRAKIRDGSEPMPLFSCLHVKRHVSALVFHEWVEFSPYEIGLAKYGTFLKSEMFGNKYYMGKVIQPFAEPPLHYLMGLWGSAFTILLTRIFKNKPKKDPIQMLRPNDSTDDELKELSSDAKIEGFSENEDAVDGNSDSGSDSSESSQETDDDGDNDDDNELFYSCNGSLPQNEGAEKTVATRTTSEDISLRNWSRKSSLKQSCEGKVAHTSSSALRKAIRQLSISEQVEPPHQHPPLRKMNNVYEIEAKVEEKVSLSQNTNGGQGHQQHNDKQTMVANPSDAAQGGSFLAWALQKFLHSTGLLYKRFGRAAKIHNFMHGLSLHQCYPFSPVTELFTPGPTCTCENKDECDCAAEPTFGEIFEAHSPEPKTLYLVDAGLTFNSPYPLLLRPQREVDIYLSFDFSRRKQDSTPPFKEILLAAKWAKLNKVKFPPIDPKVIEREGPKECYVFKDDTDPTCPIILHFPLVNESFKNYKAPGVPRETEEEKEFGNFSIFEDPADPYSTFNFSYTPRAFDRLTKLMEYNILSSMDLIKREIAACIQQRRNNHPPALDFMQIIALKNRLKKYRRINDAASLFGKKQNAVKKTSNKRS